MRCLSKSFAVVLILVQMAAFIPATILAAPPQPVEEKYEPLSEAEIRAEFGLLDNVDVLTDDEMSELIALCHRIGAFLEVREDGTLALNLQDPELVGVDQAFLADYETGIAEINELIKQQWLTVNEDLELEPGPALPVNEADLDAGMTAVEDQVAGTLETEALPAGTALTSRGRSGFLFSFHSGRHGRFPYRYASLGPTFASHYRYGRYGARYSLLFGLNRGFFHHTYRYGGYGYVPYYRHYRYGYNRFYYYPYHSRSYGRWYYRNLYY